MKEQYQIFIPSSDVVDSIKAREDLAKTLKEADQDTRQEALDEIASKIKTKDGKTIAEQAFDSLEIVTKLRPSVATSDDANLRKEVLTTLEQDKKDAEKSSIESGFYITFNTDGDIVAMGWSSKSADRLTESERAAISKRMEQVPYGPKQNQTSFRRRSDGPDKNDKK